LLSNKLSQVMSILHNTRKIYYQSHGLTMKLRPKHESYNPMAPVSYYWQISDFSNSLQSFKLREILHKSVKVTKGYVLIFQYHCLSFYFKWIWT